MFGAILGEIREEGTGSHNRPERGLEGCKRGKLSVGKIWLRLQKTQRSSSLKSSAIVVDVDVFHRINYLMNELHGDARDDSLRFGESTLQCA